MDDPPPYPRIPHLPPGRGASRDDGVLTPSQARPFFEEEVVVEEKLDGANVTLWLDELGVVQPVTRGGRGALDRAGQLGPLRAWVAERSDDLRGLLEGGWVLYGEWLWLSHGISYGRLPDWLIGIDLWHPDFGFEPLIQRHRRLSATGIARPPEVARGILGSAPELDELMHHSAFGDERPEGVMVRRLQASESKPRVAKAVASSYSRRSDDEWRHPVRNALAV